MENKQNSILVIIDGSYFLYFLTFSAVSEFQKKCEFESKVLIKSADETDQSHLPDLLVSDNFRRILKQTAMHKCEILDWYLKNTFQEQLDYAKHVDFIFAQDDYVKNSFRKNLYPEYKAHRHIAKKSFDVYKIHDYVLNVIFKELEVESKYGYRFIKVNGAEGDDVIATIAKHFSKDYMSTVLFASDRDFVQLENIHQMTLFGKEVECKIGDETVSRDEYLLAKIITGDKSDNIGQVFSRVGPKTALKLVRDQDRLNKMLNESQTSAHQFLLNKKLISFEHIPQELTERIVEKASSLLYSNDIMNNPIDMSTFMMM